MNKKLTKEEVINELENQVKIALKICDFDNDYMTSALTIEETAEIAKCEIALRLAIRKAIKRIKDE